MGSSMREPGLGIYICALGGILAVVAGIIALVSKATEPEPTIAMGADYRELGSPVGAGSTASTPLPAPVAPEPETSSVPEPPRTPPPGEPSGGDDATTS